MKRYKTGLETVEIVHETTGRIRMRAEVLGNPALDTSVVEAGLEAVKGVSSIRINQKASSIVVCYDPDTNARAKIFETLTSFSHSIFYAEDEVASTPDMINVWWAGTIWLLKLFLPPFFQPASTLLGAFPILLDGIETLINRGLKVEVLDASVITMLLLRRDYFTASSLCFMLNLGHYLEESTEFRSNRMLNSLLKPEIDEVWILDGASEKKIAVEDIKVGDLVVTGPGEMIPVDGALSSGEGLINQASITGESLPVTPQKGDQVYSGTVVVEGKLIISAEKVGSETTTARIAKFITNSLKNKSKTETKAFRMADNLVPLTFATGLGALAVTGDLKKSSSVLSVDYSCALKLVTPTAIKASMYNAAHEGILIKGAQALETLSEINTVIFDKTGTLTKGALTVSKIISYNGKSEDEVLRIAASAEEHYSHPIASAVVNEAKTRGIELEETGEVDFIIAHGVSAYVGDMKVLVGSHHFIDEDENINCSLAEADASKMRGKGQSVLYVAIDGKLSGIIAMTDELRPEARDVIAALKNIGIKRVVMLTGDHRDAAKEIGRQLDLDEVFYELKPEDKASIVQKLKDEGSVSAFIGDGVNDAPALLSADVGISLPQGADLARETAQVLLLREDLNCLIHAKRIADETVKVINRVFKTNIGANSVTVLLSLLGLLTPLYSSLIHNGTTLGSLVYAMSLSDRKKRIEKDELT